MDYDEIKTMVQDAMANSGILADLTERVHALTNPEPTPSASFSDEEAAAMAKAVAELRQRKIEEAKQAEEDAKLKAWTQDIRNGFIQSGRISPETDAERKLWRDAHGRDYRDYHDLTRGGF